MLEDGLTWETILSQLWPLLLPVIAALTRWAERRLDRAGFGRELKPVTEQLAKNAAAIERLDGHLGEVFGLLGLTRDPEPEAAAALH